MREKIVLIGAGSAMFTRGLLVDLMDSAGEFDLALVDIDPSALEAAEKLAAKMIAARNAPIRLSACLDRREALPGAGVVICTIGVGGRRAWEQDVFIPRRHGIYMPVGDTVGPGGTSRAMRMIPAMVDIAKDMLDLAPQALFFNYGNPMAPVCRAVRKATGAPIVGLCHGVKGTAGYLAQSLEVPADEFQYTAVGVNHLTWFVSARSRGIDLFPRLRAIAGRKAAQAPASELPPAPGEGSKDGFSAHLDEPFSWQLVRLFDAFPAPMDRHVTEFFPQFFRGGGYYGRTLGIDAFSFEGTIAYGDEIYAQMQADALGPGPLPADYFERLGGEHEQVIEIIDAIRQDRQRIYSANLPNAGQVPNLPQEAILESPAIAGSEGIKPIAQPPLSPGLAGTLATRCLWVETVVEAALEGSRAKFIQALILDGAVSSPESAATLADELLAAQAQYLPWMQPAPGELVEKTGG